MALFTWVHCSVQNFFYLNPFPDTPVTQLWSTLTIWTQFRRCFSLNDFSVYAPIERNHLFRPSITNRAFDIWVETGVTTVENLLIDNSFASFDQLTSKFNIPRSHFFRFLQLRRFISTSSSYFSSKPPSSFLDSIIKLHPSSKRSIWAIFSYWNNANWNLWLY